MPNKITWVLESNVFDREAELAEEIKNQKMEVAIADKLKFIYDMYSIVPAWHHPNHGGDQVVFRGSINTALTIMRKQDEYSCRWSPGVLCNLKDYDFFEYSQLLGEHLLNKDYHLLSVEEARRRASELESLYKNQELFIKPNSGFKPFEAKIRNIHKIKQNLVLEGKDTKSKMVVLSSPKKIDKEWRFFVSQKFGTYKIITGSLCKEQGELCIKNADNCGDSLLKTYLELIFTDLSNSGCLLVKDDLFTIDICLSGGEFYVLEINSFSCSGLYDCNIPNLVAAVKDMYEWGDVYDWV